MQDRGHTKRHQAAKPTTGYSGPIRGETEPERLKVSNLLKLYLALKQNKDMNPQISSIIGALVRHGLNAIGGGLVANGTITGGQIETIGGAITIVLVTAWSIWQKKRSA